MDSQRNRINKLVQYIKNFNVDVNLGKTFARGNKGIFIKKGGKYRIDISREVDESNILSTLLHEIAHFIHYRYDNSLNKLDFVFENLSEEECEELLEITVKKVPKDFASKLYKLKNDLKEENQALLSRIKREHPDFKVSAPSKTFTNSFRYLFGNLSDAQSAYLKYKLNQKNINNINARINKLNKYYNQPTELWARFFELYMLDKKTAQNIAPKISKKFEENLSSGKVLEAKGICDIMNKKF